MPASVPSSEAIALWRLFDHLAVKGESKKIPHGIGQIVCDARLCLYLDRELNRDLSEAKPAGPGEAISRELLYELFVADPPRPVREAHALITEWIAGHDRAEQREMLERWGRKRKRLVPERPGSDEALASACRAACRADGWTPAETDTRERIVGAYFGGAK